MEGERFIKSSFKNQLRVTAIDLIRVSETVLE